MPPDGKCLYYSTTKLSMQSEKRRKFSQYIVQFVETRTAARFSAFFVVFPLLQKKTGGHVVCPPGRPAPVPSGAQLLEQLVQNLGLARREFV